MNLLKSKKAKNKKISMVTCYDASFAKALEASDVDAILVGDSVAMVIYGFENTLYADVDMIARHTKAVRAGYSGFLISDIPFLTMQKSQTDFVLDVQKLMQAGANALKVEGFLGNEEKLKLLKAAGIPFVGHVGLTPQFVNEFGGFQVQGRNEKAAQKIVEEAKSFEAVGAFSLVVECVPSALTQELMKNLSIPVVGIGAGGSTDGQVLVLQDLLGLTEKKFKFVKTYDNFFQKTVNAVNQYTNDLEEKDFPKEEHSFL